jgi:hypothetical protein
VKCWKCNRNGHIARYCKEPEPARKESGQKGNKRLGKQSKLPQFLADQGSLETTVKLIRTVRTAGSNELAVELTIEGKRCQFLVDTGACASLVKPDIGTELAQGFSYVVRGVTGSELQIRGLRRLEFQLGAVTYEHEFLVAEIATCCLGILRLDALRAMQATVDLWTDQLIVGRESFSLVDHGKREHSSSDACCTSQRMGGREAAQTAGPSPNYRWSLVRLVTLPCH